MSSEHTSVELDMYASSVVACAIGTAPGELIRSRLTSRYADVLDRVACPPGPTTVVYEAGPTGAGPTGAGPVRTLTAVRCAMLVHSKLQRPAALRA
jgi:hypothetical protein